jgi:heat shock protein HtpX
MDGDCKPHYLKTHQIDLASHTSVLRFGSSAENGSLVIGILTKYTSLPLLSILSRSRESVADRTAATVTGSPAALASALRTLDERIENPSDTDLRDKSLSAMSILPPDPFEESTEEVNENAGPIVSGVNRLGDGVDHIIRVFIATHPPTAHRIDVLTDLEAEQERET